MASRKQRRAKAAKLKAERTIRSAQNEHRAMLEAVVDSHRNTVPTEGDLAFGRAWSRVKSSHLKVVENFDALGPKAHATARQLAGNRGIVQRPTTGKASKCRRIPHEHDTQPVRLTNRGQWVPVS